MIVDDQGQEAIMNADQDEGRIENFNSEGMNVAGKKVEIEKSERKGMNQKVSGRIQTRHDSLRSYLGKVM